MTSASERLAAGVRIAAYLLAIDGLVALLLAGLVGPPMALIFGAALAASAGRHLLARRLQVVWLGSALAVIAAGAALVDLLYLAETILEALVRVLLFLVAVRLFTMRSPRDARVVAFLAFFMLVAASSAAFGVGFLFAFVAFLLLSTWLLLLQHVLGESEPRPRHAVVGPAEGVAGARWLLAVAAGASVATLLITAVLFFLIPRVGLAALPLRGKAGPRVSGFAERVELGAYGTIETDPSIAMRVYIPEGLDAPDQIPNLRWRGIVFDRFDGHAWIAGRPERTVIHRPLSGDFRVRPPRGRGLRLVQDFFVEPLGTEVIFGAPQVLRVDARTHAVTVDDMGVVQIASPAARLSYRVESELEGAPVLASRDGWDAMPRDDRRLARFLQLPPMNEGIPAMARAVAGNASSPYEAAQRLTDFLSRQFAYSLTIERPSPGVAPLEDFLFVSRTGNCEYFASSLAVLLRSLGIPARVVGGFQRGEWNPYGRYFTVRMRDAHSWVEAYFPSAGWVSFDPSPRARGDQSASAAALWLDAVRMHWYRYVVNWSLRDQVEVALAVRREVRTWGAWRVPLGSLGAPPRGVLISAAVSVLALLVAWLWRRRGSAQRGPRPGAAVPRFYARALRALARSGLEPAHGETAREFAARVDRARPTVGDGFARVTVLYERARFGAADPAADEIAAIDATLSALEAPAPGR